jgi:hypothetical protein
LKTPSQGPAGGFVYEHKKNRKGEEVGGLVSRITLKSIANNSFPIVTGYHEQGQFDVFIDWNQVAKVTIDPMRIPQIVELTPLTTPEGALAACGPGEKPVLSLKDWRAMFRVQQVAFRLAREVCIRWQGDNGAAAVPVQVLFPKVAFAAKRFLAEKLERKGDSEPWSANICRQRLARCWKP